MQTSSPQKSLGIDDWIGLLVVVFILGMWFISLVSLLPISVSNSNWFSVIGCILGRTYLHTGLFILAHDAMHGNLVPHHKVLNNFVGRLAVGIYGFLSYEHCCLNHRDHHRYPSQSGDPDFHGEYEHPVFWYGKFLLEYFPMRSLIIFIVNVSVIYLALTTIFHVSLINLILFWLLPLIFSSLQLFFFGTYLPHRDVQDNSNFSPRLHSDRYSVLWSFLSCYNFGHYHWEHHEYPKTPWYRLHNIHQ